MLLKRTLTVLLALAAAVSLFSCRKNEASPTPAPTEQPSAAPVPTPTAEPTADPAAQAKAEAERLVEEYCELIRPSVLEQSKQYEEAGMTMDVLCEGKDLVYVYRYITFVPALPSAIRESLDAQGSSLMEMYYDIAAYADDASVRVILRYIGSDGYKIIDYVIDKDYEFAQNAAAVPTEGFASLREFVESDYFKSQLAGGASNTYGRIECEVEGENTLIIKHILTRRLSGVVLNREKTAWEDFFKRNGKASADLIHKYIEMLVPGIDPSSVAVIYRLYDSSGRLVAEYRAYELPQSA